MHARRPPHLPSFSLHHTSPSTYHHYAGSTATVGVETSYTFGLHSLGPALTCIGYVEPKAVACPLYESHAEPYIPTITTTTDRFDTANAQRTSQSVSTFVIKLL
jgi:hypothetical protein